MVTQSAIRGFYQRSFYLHQQDSLARRESRCEDAPVSRRAWIAFATCSVLWGVPYYLIKIAVEDNSPAFVAWARIALGALVLAPIAWRVGAFRGIRERWKVVLLFAVVEISIPFTLIPVGERYISSSMAAILIAAVPLTIAIMAARVDPSERPTGARLVGLFVGLAGVVALVGIDVAGRPKELIGALCMVVATVGYAAGPMIIRTKMSDLHPMGPVAASLAIAAVLLAPAGIVYAPSHVPHADVIAALVVLGVACTAIALATMFFLVAEAGPSKASIITYVNPVIAVALGVAFLGESLGAASVAGLLLILAGSYLATGGRPPSGLVRLAFRPRADRLPRPSSP
jgi:drug/metabolite transporter (DMT)-like permease